MLLHTAPRRTPTRRPLLFVHGVYHGAWCFQEHFVPYFAALGHPCYALTLRGHGGDATAPCRFGRADYATDVRDALASIPAETLAVGHSLGGMLLQTLLAQDAIREAVLLATPTPAALFLRSVRYTLRRPGIMLPAWLRLDMQRVYHREDAASDNFFSPDLPPDMRARYLGRLRTVSYGAWAFLTTVLAPVPRPAKASGVPSVVIVENRFIRTRSRWRRSGSIIAGVGVSAARVSTDARVGRSTSGPTISRRTESSERRESRRTRRAMSDATSSPFSM
jgi:pimeloyl-ACP methyl ester carboxylesterase